MKKKLVFLIVTLLAFTCVYAQKEITALPQGISIDYQVSSSKSIKVLGHGIAKLCNSMIVDGNVATKPMERLNLSEGKHTIVWILKDGTSVPKNFVKGIEEITAIKIPSSVKTIHDYAFSNCKGLTEAVVPNSVTVLGEYVFENCSELSNLSLSANLIEIKTGTFSGCEKLTTLELPQYIQKIDALAFYECKGIEKLVFPNLLMEIGESAFRGCTSLQEVTLPNSVTKVGESAFEGCTSVRSFTFPGSVERIEFCAFRYCTSLYQIVFKGTIVQWKNIEPTSWKEIDSKNIPVHCTNGDTEFQIDQADKNSDI